MYTQRLDLDAAKRCLEFTDLVMESEKRSASILSLMGKNSDEFTHRLKSFREFLSLCINSGFDPITIPEHHRRMYESLWTTFQMAQNKDLMNEYISNYLLGNKLSPDEFLRKHGVIDQDNPVQRLTDALKDVFGEKNVRFIDLNSPEDMEKYLKSLKEDEDDED